LFQPNRFHSENVNYQYTRGTSIIAARTDLFEYKACREPLSRQPSVARATALVRVACSRSRRVYLRWRVYAPAEQRRNVAAIGSDGGGYAGQSGQFRPWRCEFSRSSRVTTGGHLQPREMS